jgi:serine/threonine-protein kinase
VLKPGAAEAQTKRFLAEGRGLALAQHANLPDIYDSGKTAPGMSPGLTYLALELSTHPSLRQLLRDARGPLPMSRAAAIGSGILAGVAVAHAAQIVHGEIKPENILVAPGDRATVVNFAFARHVGGQGGSSGTRRFANSSSYTAPELSQGKDQSFDSDQFACGAILYEMLTGVRPFETPGEVRRLGEIAPGLPKELAAAVERSIEPVPEDRHPKVEALRAIVAKFVK